MFDISRDIVNLTKAECTPSRLLKIFAANEINLSSNDWDATFNTHCVFDKYHIYLTEPSKKIREYREKVEYDKDNYKNPLVFPDDEDFRDILLLEVKSIRNEIKSWFDFIIENGTVDGEKLSNFLYKHNVNLRSFTELEGEFKPDFFLSPCDDSLKNYTISHDFILPLQKGYGKEFKRIKRCPECGKYFYAKDLRQIFCETSCKNTNFYKSRKSN